MTQMPLIFKETNQVKKYPCPVCGTDTYGKIPAAQGEVDGQKVYYCSKECARKGE